MKKIFAILMAAVMTLACCAALAEDAALPESIVMGFDSAYPPMTYTDEDGLTYIGFDIDLAKEVCGRLGIELVYQPISWDFKADELDAGNIDCIWSGLTMTEELMARFAFSLPYMANEQVLVVRADSGIASIDDVAGKALGTQTGSSSVDVLDDNPDFTASIENGAPYLYNDFVFALDDLKEGGLDVVLVDSVVAKAYISKGENQDLFSILPEMLLAEEYGIAFRKDDAALADAVTQAIIEICDDGTLAEITAKWFENDATVVAKYADEYRK